MTDAADLQRDRRRYLARPGGGHDKLVRALMIGLPAAVGAVAAVMLVAPLFPRGEISFLLDRNKVATAEQRLKVEQAMYRGEDAKGRPFSLTAGQAAQTNPDAQLVTLSDLSARILLSDGPAELRAPDGVYDFGKSTVAVRGPVDFRASDGYRLSTSGVGIDMKAQHVTGAGGVTGAVPAGTFSAARIDADLDSRTITLSGRARLRMEPGKLKMPGGPARMPVNKAP